MPYKPSDRIQRNLDGVWYAAVVLKVHPGGHCLEIRYADDDNTEDEVPVDEIRTLASIENLQNSSQNLLMGSPSRNRDTLNKPLAGLIDDDTEVRRKHMPTVFVHSQQDGEGAAIILQGAENKQAAGGGLRALRYLKS